MYNPIIFALDVSTEKLANTLIEETSEFINFYKIGYELFLTTGLQYINKIEKHNLSIFLDLKLNDIPETVYRTVKTIAESTRVSYLSIAGNDNTIQAALAGRGQYLLPKLLFLTQLTTTKTDIVSNTTKILERTLLGQKYNVDGFICPGYIVSVLRRMVPPSILVCPGIRLSSGDNDHVFTSTPKQAIQGGANHIVIGRPIRDSTEKEYLINTILNSIY